jgi:hypothetical protein
MDTANTVKTFSTDIVWYQCEKQQMRNNEQRDTKDETTNNGIRRMKQVTIVVTSKQWQQPS